MLIILFNPKNVCADEYFFDESLLIGSVYNSAILRDFSKKDFSPGEYQVDIFVNDHFAFRDVIYFYESEKNYCRVLMNIYG